MWCLSIGNIHIDNKINKVIDKAHILCYSISMNRLQDKINELIETDRRDKEIARLRADGWTLQKIADKFDLTRQRVWAILRRESDAPNGRIE